MARLPLHALQGFAAAARSGNLTRAAEAMHLTVSALSHQVRALEEKLLDADTTAPQVTLHAVRGMTIVGDTLWACDTDAVRGFDRNTGEPVGEIPFGEFEPGFLNDITAGEDGELYVTDTGRNRIYRIDGRTPSIALEDEAPPQGAGESLLQVAAFAAPRAAGSLRTRRLSIQSACHAVWTVADSPATAHRHVRAPHDPEPMTPRPPSDPASPAPTGTESQPDTGELAIVMTGGGARGAYQVGLLRFLARRYPDVRLILAHAGISDLAWIWREAAETPNLLFDTAWWTVTFPGLAITLFVLGASFLGDALRDWLDPRSN